MFAYCNNNVVNLADSGGTRSQMCIDDQFNAMRMPWQDGPTGGKSAYSLIVYPPNPNPWITPVELINDAIASKKIVSGAINVFTGVAILLIPDPIPVADEVKAVAKVGKGLVQIISGLLKLVGVNTSLGGI